MSSAADADQVSAAAAADHAEPPTQQLLLATVGDRCVNCGSPLASDQRYCVNCGERRGKPRFTLAPSGEPAGDVVAKTTSARFPRRPRPSTGFNLIAGIATLLLAMGVGVLIGHNGGTPNSSKAAAAPTVITVAGGSGNAATPNPGASGGRGGSHGSLSAGKSRTSNTATPTKAPPKVVIQKAAAAASKVVGGGAKVAPPTVSQGQSCASGSAGCAGGHFNGSFFGQ